MANIKTDPPSNNINNLFIDVQLSENEGTDFRKKIYEQLHFNTKIIKPPLIQKIIIYLYVNL